MPPQTPPNALRYPRFAACSAAALLSNVGTWMQNVTVPYLLYAQTGSATLVGIATMAQFLPAGLSGPLGGWVADRFDRRRLLVLTHAGLALAAAGLWVVWLLGAASPPAIILLVAIGGVGNGLRFPVWKAFLGDLVPRASLFSAVSLDAAQFNIARAIGPAIAGGTLATLGPGFAFLCNAVTFVVVMAALIAARSDVGSPVTRAGSVIRDLAVAARHMRRERHLRSMLLLAVTMAALGSPVVQLAPVFARDVFGVGPTSYGMLVAAFGVGAALGAPALSVLGGRVRHRARMMVRSMAGFAFALIAFSLAPTYAIGIALLFGAGVMYVVTMSTQLVLVQLHVPDELRGRIVSFAFVAFTVGYPTGALVQGWSADIAGAPTTVLAAGSILLALSVVLMLDRSVAHLDELGDGSPASHHGHGQPAPEHATP